LALALPAAQAQLLSNGGFDNDPLDTIAAVINSQGSMVFGKWGQESATLVGVVQMLPVVPLSNPLMLSTAATSGVTSQTVQAINVSSLATMIQNGANFTLSANYNAVHQGRVGGIAMQFFGSDTYASQIGVPVSGGVITDNIPATWQNLSISGLIPQGTQSMMAQVYYTNASLPSNTVVFESGFVDSVEFQITQVPEPGSWALLAAGGAWLIWRSRRRAAQRA
jgi:hypothetical protein